MGKARIPIKFTVTVDGQTYDCERTIEGTRVLHQRVYVKGIGGKDDSATYGQRGHPASSMEGSAKMIAYEIIRSAKAKA